MEVVWFHSTCPPSIDRKGLLDSWWLGSDQYRGEELWMLELEKDRRRAT
jgi:hypothetical protein